MKTERLFIRVSKETKKRVQDDAQKLKITVSYYLIALVENKMVKVQALPDENAMKLKVELARIGTNLWTLIKYNKALKLSEKISLEMLVSELKKTSKTITEYYDSKDNFRK